MVLIPAGACLWMDYEHVSIEELLLAFPEFIGMFFAWAGHGAAGFIGLGAGGAFMLSAWFFCQDIAPVGMFYGAFVASAVVFAPLGGMLSKLYQAVTAFLVVTSAYWLPAFIARVRRVRE